ncbi:hypothetical protein HDU91_005715 [Kappamyces sp. JEL0680]|nr:hypothetical protein HDU91_005715 [Kappamyces sp. JEL0680]
MTTTIKDLPVELLQELCLIYIDPLDLFRLSHVCRRLYALGTNETLWQMIFHRATARCSNTEGFLDRIKKDLAKGTPGMANLKTFFMSCLHRFAPLLGLWHKDYSFYMGGLVRLRLKSAAEWVDLAPYFVVAESLVCAETEDELASFSYSRNISIHQLLNREIKSRLLFGVGAKGRITCLGKGVKYIHDAWMEQVSNVEEDAAPSIDLTSRLGPKSFPTGLPDPQTGLWAFPTFSSTSDNTLHQIRESRSLRTCSVLSLPAPLQPSIFSVDCLQKCHCNRIRTPERAGSPARPTLDYTTKFSAIRFARPRPRAGCTFPRPGVWMANYGDHGNEFLAVSYTLASGHPEMVVTKVTGDMNVPRGEQSIACALDEWSTRLGYNASIPIDKSEEFAGCRAYKGRGTIALEGYLNASTVPIDVIVKSETEFFVYWYGLFDDVDGQTGWINKYVYMIE